VRARRNRGDPQGSYRNVVGGHGKAQRRQIVTSVVSAPRAHTIPVLFEERVARKRPILFVAPRLSRFRNDLEPPPGRLLAPAPSSEAAPRGRKAGPTAARARALPDAAPPARSLPRRRGPGPGTGPRKPQVGKGRSRCCPRTPRCSGPARGGEGLHRSAAGEQQHFTRAKYASPLLLLRRP
jgi:hypothetical protein